MGHARSGCRMRHEEATQPSARRGRRRPTRQTQPTSRPRSVRQGYKWTGGEVAGRESDRDSAPSAAAAAVLSLTFSRPLTSSWTPQHHHPPACQLPSVILYCTWVVELESLSPARVDGNNPSCSLCCQGAPKTSEFETTKCPHCFVFFFLCPMSPIRSQHVDDSA